MDTVRPLFYQAVRGGHHCRMPTANPLLVREGGWNLRYFLTDDSAAEQKGFHEAFKGMEPPVKCLLYSVHSHRTLQLNLGKSPALEHMVAALRSRRSEAGCMESIQAAVEAANEKDRRYIERNWKDCTPLWARMLAIPCLFLRKYVLCIYRAISSIYYAILTFTLQVSTTNAVESWHRKLKTGVKAECTRITRFWAPYFRSFSALMAS